LSMILIIHILNYKYCGIAHKIKNPESPTWKFGISILRFWYQ
jgi:hypothetical protein